MANTTPFQQYKCKECGLQLNSAESLEVHRQYHESNLMQQWTASSATTKEEKNNNMTKPPTLKRELLVIDERNKSPEFQNAQSQEFGHPPTPQSYQSASSPYSNNDYAPNFLNYKAEEFQQQYEQFSNYNQTNNYRYHPYNVGRYYEAPKTNAPVSPAYMPQPTPSPSPKQCDKCGFICEFEHQLLEHTNLSHGSFNSNLQFIFDPNHSQPTSTKEDDQSDILDLDSHKVVHPTWVEKDKPTTTSNEVVWNNDGFQPPEFAAQQQQPHEGFQNPPPQPPVEYRPFEQISAQTVSTTQPTPPPPTRGGSTKSANWKSNEARRPKTYNCTACNKWFTSSGHLKRHYNTTLHKNAVKSSGQPDPATMPISAHHHPARDSATSKDDSRNSTSPREDSSRQSEDSQHTYDTNNQRNYQQSAVESVYQQPAVAPAAVEEQRFAATTNWQTHHHMVPMEAAQYQMYPNGFAPHVTQATDTTNNINISGDFVQQIVVEQPNQQTPLPSFAHFQAHVFGGYANVGGMGGLTLPTSTSTANFETFDMFVVNNNEAQYQTPVVSTTTTTTPYVEPMIDQSEKENNNMDAAPSPPQPVVTSSTTTTTNNNQDLSKTKCFDCDKVFNRPCYLTQHNKTCHNGDKPFKCPRCGKRFPNEETYEGHARKHAGDKPHKCDRCPKMFNHKTDLRRHHCCHTGRKPYACTICGKGFIRKDHMVKHMDTHLRKREKNSAMRS